MYLLVLSSNLKLYFINKIKIIYICVLNNTFILYLQVQRPGFFGNGKTSRIKSEFNKLETRKTTYSLALFSALSLDAHVIRSGSRLNKDAENSSGFCSRLAEPTRRWRCQVNLNPPKFNFHIGIECPNFK